MPRLPNCVRLAAACVVAALLLGGASARALDTVQRKSTDKPAAGEITSVTKTEIVVTPKIGEALTIPANDVEVVEWEGEPPALKLGRSQERSGQFTQALKQYETAANEYTGANSNLKADLEFLVARTTGSLALGDPAQHQAALAGLKAFVERNRDHYRFYDTQLLLGQVAMAAGDFTASDAAFNAAAAAPWPDYQMAGKIGLARALVERNDLAGAKAAFDAVAAMNAATPQEASRKLEAMLGQAHCLQLQKSFAEAVKILAAVIEQSTASDSRVQAEAYLRQGDCFSAMGTSPKEAVFAYLHVDVIPAFAREQDLHAEALYHLVQLWPVLGKPERAAEAAAKLEQQYPNSEWTKKLAGGASS